MKVTKTSTQPAFQPIEPWRYFVAVLACTIWAVPSAFKTFGG